MEGADERCERYGCVEVEGRMLGIVGALSSSYLVH